MMSAHSGGNVAVANRGDFGMDVVLCCPVEKALIAHDGNCDTV